MEIENDKLDPAALGDFLRRVLKPARAACRPGASWYVKAPQGPLSVVFGTVLLELEVFRHGIVWLKDRFVLATKDNKILDPALTLKDAQVGENAELLLMPDPTGG